MNRKPAVNPGASRDRLIQGTILFLFAVYAAAFIWRTSFLIGGERYFSLFDDAMISMRYARNLVSGFGLVMNPGERVEGITNPLWTLYMAMVHLLPLPMSKISLVIQITGALMLAGVIVLIWRLALLISGGDRRAAIAAAVFTAFYLPLVNWTLQGMETGLQALLITVVALGAIRAMQAGSMPVWLFVLAGVGTLVRIDMAVPYLVIWLFVLWALPGERRRNLLVGAAVFAVFLGGQTLARLLYYGDPLPNTYYLKMTGYPMLLRIARGAWVMLRFAWRLNPLFFLLPLAVIAGSRSRERLLLGLLVLGQIAYSVYVGGDAWEDWGGANRYVAFVMPLFFVLLADALARASDLISGMVASDDSNRVGRFLFRWRFTLLAALAFAGTLDNPVFFNSRGLLLFDRPPHVDNNRTMVERALVIRDITTLEASVAVTWAGAIPYFSERYTVDILGKSDPVVARLPMRRAGEGENALTFFLPGHLKWNYRHSIGEQQPDVVAQFWGDIAEAEPYILGGYTRLESRGYVFYLRNGSPYVRWNLFGGGQGED